MEQASDYRPDETPPPQDPPPWRAEDATVTSSFDSRDPDRGMAHRSRGNAVIAWMIIILLCLFWLGLRAMSEQMASNASPDAAHDDPIGLLVMEAQAKYMVGAAELAPGQRRQLYSNTEESLFRGTIPQRHRFIVLANELAGPAEAWEKLNELESLVALEAQQPSEAEFSFTPTQLEIQRILRTLYQPPPDVELATDAASAPVSADAAAWSANVDALSASDRDLLKQELGWFGQLALAPPGTSDVAARDAALEPALRTTYIIAACMVIGIAAGVIGFAGLIAVLVLTVTRKIRSAVGPGRGPHAIYAETFAVWMLLMLVNQYAAALIGNAVPQARLLLAGLGMLLTLVALGWPVLRGIPFQQVRADIGWTLGRQPGVEPFIGVAGYFMALPLVAVGLLITLLFLAIQQLLVGEGPTFGPTSGPAHPIIGELAAGNVWVMFQILFLAAVVAPLVEETAFRGILYRHLRDGTAKAGMLASIAISTFLNSFIFALIHPQGWVAIPALMSLAIAFSLLREWRDTLIPPMIVHGMSNFIVMTLAMTVLGA